CTADPASAPRRQHRKAGYIQRAVLRRGKDAADETAIRLGNDNKPAGLACCDVVYRFTQNARWRIEAGKRRMHDGENFIEPVSAQWKNRPSLRSTERRFDRLEG